MKETRIEIRKKCEDGVVNIVDNDNNPIGSQTVESGGVETYVVTDLPCGDGFAEIKKSDGTTITTVTVPSETTVPYNVADSVISIAGGTINVKATDPVTITHEDTNGNPVNTSLNGTVVTVNDLPPQKELDILVPYYSGDAYATITIVVDSDGTITTADTSGLTNVTYELNSAPTTLPLTLTVGDVLTINFDVASTDGVIKLKGNYA